MPKGTTLNNPRLEIAESTKSYMAEGIRHVCETFKKRLPGTQSERDAQAFFKEELEKITDPSKGDSVIMEDFDVHPHAFMGFLLIAGICMLGNIACYWLSGKGSVLATALGVVLALFALLVTVFEFLMYREFVDFLFPKRVSRNVYAVRKPAGEVRRRIIFGGHTDVANEWTYSQLGGPLGWIAMGGAVAGLILGLVASIVRLAFIVQIRLAEAPALEEGMILKGDAFKLMGGWLILGIALLCTIPFILAIMKFINYKVAVDGANDNLSANYIAMSVLKEMHDAGVRFGNTEVGCLITGAEEAGLRGAKAFAKKHKEELSDVDTVFISMDTMHEIKEMRVCNFGCTGSVQNDKAVGALLHEAALACGADIPNGELYPGAVDAEAFSMYGLRSTGFTAVRHSPASYYHTRQDTADNIDEECLALSLNICKEAARIFDMKGC